MAHLRVAWDDRRYHRPEGGVIHAIHQGDPHIFGPAERSRQLPRHREASESAADDEDLGRGAPVAALERDGSA